MKKLFLLLFGLLVFTGAASAQTIDFEDLTLDSESFWNGSDGSGGFQSGFAFFSNTFDEEYGSWSGFAYSNRTDTEAREYVFSVGPEDGGDFNAITGEGHNGSEIYSVAYASGKATITLDNEREITGAYFTNNNIAYYVMLEGNDFSDPFDENDWLEVTVTGFDAEEEETGDLVFYLAQDGEILDEWKWVDFSILGAVKKIEFTMDSSDTGEFGMNTPAYFCMDSVNGNSPAEESEEDDDDDSSGCFIGTAGSGWFSRSGR